MHDQGSAELFKKLPRMKKGMSMSGKQQTLIKESGLRTIWWCRPRNRRPSKLDLQKVLCDAKYGSIQLLSFA